MLEERSSFDKMIHCNLDDGIDILTEAMEQANDFIMITEAMLEKPGPRILYANRALIRNTGYSFDESR